MGKTKEKSKKLPGTGTRILSLIPVFNWIALIILGKRCAHTISFICGIAYGALSFAYPEAAAYIWIIGMIQYAIVRRKIKKKLSEESSAVVENNPQKENLIQKKTEETINRLQTGFAEIVLDGGEEEKQLIPQKSAETERNLIRVGVNTSYYGYSSGNKFFDDMKKFEGKTGKPVPFVPFMTYWPTYDSMDVRQRDWYFYWRTEVRNENYIDTDLSYIFIYIYELLSGYGWKEPQEGYEKLMEVWMEYRDRFLKLDTYLFGWIFDFAQLHNLKYSVPEMKDIYLPYQQTIKDIFIDNHSEDRPLKLPFELIDSLCDYSLTGSKFYKDGHQLLMQEAIPRVIALVDASLIKKKNKGILALYGPNRTRKQTYVVFQSAVCPDANKQMEISVKAYTSSPKLRGYINEIVRYGENTLRAMYGYRGRLRGVTVEEETAVLIEKFLKKEYSPATEMEDGPVQNVGVKLNFASINELRSQSDAVRDALEVPEQMEQKALLTDLEEVKVLLGTLSLEARALMDILAKSKWECVNTPEKNNLVDEINTQANKYLACALIVREQELFIVEDDYRDELEYIYANQVEIAAPEENSAQAEGHFVMEKLSDEMQQLVGALTTLQAETLAVILKKEDLQVKLEKIAEEAMTMPEIILDEINDIAAQFLDDILIDTLEEEPCVLEQYEEELRQAMK